LNLANGFHLGIAKLLTKFDAISLLMLFCHFTPYWNPTSTHYTSSLIGRLPVTDAFCGREKIHDSIWMSPPHLHQREPPALHWFTREKIRFDTFWTHHVCMQYSGKGYVKGTDLGLARRKWGNMHTTDNADSMDGPQDCSSSHAFCTDK
jgi:hypothetical protein